MESKKYTTFVESYFSDEQNGKEKTRNETFFIPGKIRHSFVWTYNNAGDYQVMYYFVTPK